MSSEDDNQWVADVNKALKDITDAHARATQAYKEYSRLKSNLAELNQAYAKRITDIGHTFSKKIKELKHRCFPLVQWFKDNEVGLTYRRAKRYADLVDFEDVPLLHQLFDGKWHELPCRNMTRLIPLIEIHRNETRTSFDVEWWRAHDPNTAAANTEDTNTNAVNAQNTNTNTTNTTNPSNPSNTNIRKNKSDKSDIQDILSTMGFHPKYIHRAFNLYEKNYGHKYDVEVMTELIVRLQKKDKAKRQSKENVTQSPYQYPHTNTNNAQPLNNASIATVSAEKQHRNGLIQWKITGNLLQQFHLPSFETIDGTIWRLQFYPHSAASPKYCSIYLQCVKLSANKRQIGVNYSLSIKELDWVYDSADTFKHDGQEWGLTMPFKAEQLNDLLAMNITCFCEETLDVSKYNRYFEWKVNHHLLQKWKNAKHKQEFWSPKFNCMGAEWYLRMYPNGWTTQGSAELDILCKSIASGDLNVCHFIGIETLNHCQIHMDGNLARKDEEIECSSPFNWNDIQNETEITIVIRIWKTGSIDNKEERLISNIYSVCEHRKDKMIEVQKQYSETIANLQKENERLKAEVKLEKVSIQQIKSFDSERAILEEDVMKKHKGIDFDLSSDQTWMNKWKLDSIHVQNELKRAPKETIQTPSACTRLLNQYIQCKTRYDEQLIQTNKVCTNLNETKQMLNRETVRCKEMLEKMDSDYQQLDDKYQTLKIKRVEIHKQWMNAVKDENEINALRSRTIKQYYRWKLEAEKWNVLSKKCAKLIDKYQSFTIENNQQQNIKKLKQTIGKLMDEHRQYWLKWQADDIICWIKCLQIQNELTLSDDFDFDHVLNEMKRCKMSGLSWTNMNQSD
eukprot:752901_1